MYRTTQPPSDWIQSIKALPNRPETPAKPTYGLDSPLGCLASNIAAPLYLYASLKGKHDVWGRMIAEIPESVLLGRSLDVGCGRGMVLLQVAGRKKAIPESERAYAIDIFNANDQSGNSPHATYANAASLDVLDKVVLHTSNFTETWPFADGVFSLVTSSLALHNVDEEGRRTAVTELARVCLPGGRVVLLDLMGYVKGYMQTLLDLGWKNVSCEWGGMEVMYGMWPCHILKATKPST